MQVSESPFTSKVARRLFLLIVLCAILPICALGYLSMDHVSDRLELDALRRLRYSSKSAGYLLYNRMVSMEEQLLALGSLFERSAQGMPSHEEWRETSLPFRDSIPAIKALTYYAPGGMRSVLSGSESAETLPEKERERFTMAGRSTLRTESGEAPNPAAILITPLMGHTGVESLIVAEIDISSMGEAVMNTMPPDTDLHIFESGGLQLYSSAPLDATLQRMIQGRFRESSSGSIGLVDIEREVLGVYWSLFLDGRFESRDWIVVTTTPRGLVFGAVRQFRYVLISMLLLTLLAVMLLSLWQLRNNLVPLARLKVATAKISRGEFQFRVPVTSKDEFGELASSFNQMAEELETREQELKAAQVALIHSEKMAAFGQIGAGIAHEVKNPLAGILAVAQLSMKRSEPENPLHAKMALIERETKRCRKIIDNLLKFSRQDKMPREQTSINGVLEEAVRLVEHQLAIHDIRLKLELSDGLPEVVVSPNQIQQVIMNLTMNAQEAMEGRRGTVQVLSRSGESGAVEVVVMDDGPGIPPDIVPNIFNPFFTTKGVGKGTGLGLSVSYGIIRDHDGEISVNTRPGEGTEFIISLPSAGSVAAPGGNASMTGDARPGESPPFQATETMFEDTRTRSETCDKLHANGPEDGPSQQRQDYLG